MTMTNPALETYNVKQNDDGELVCDEDTCIRHGRGTRECPLIIQPWKED